MFKLYFIPGPCPPCPKNVSNSCHCGQQPPKTRRCSAKAWSCGHSCGRILSCGQHSCQEPCHPGDCSPCPRKSLQSCSCGSSTQLRECAQPVWHCDKVLSCPSYSYCKMKNCNIWANILTICITDIFVMFRCATSNTVVVTIGVSKSATKEGVVLVPAVGCAHVRVAKLLTHSHAPKKSPVVETPVEKSYPVEYTCVLNAATKGLVQRYSILYVPSLSTNLAVWSISSFLKVFSP